MDCGRLLALALATVLVGGCTVPPAAIDQAGRLEVLGPDAGFSTDPLPTGWIMEGSPGNGRLEVVDVQGVPALSVVNGDEGFVLARHTEANMLATPYLSWAWHVDAQRSGIHPIRLVVGFSGGNPDGDSWGGGSFAGMGSALPSHDRVLSIAWGESALRRGSMVRPPGPEPRALLYTVRGGRENTGSWWLETVDLSQLYAIAWPGDVRGRVRVAFIGLSAAAGRLPAAARISGVVLSR